ncbi:hypothetical protein AVT10_00015 [Sphingomonas hankookensis]|uniref:Uncharacterized protein n=1 Tax=Sphingomonas hankookensis TaxID=563996 RepID=A0ABR5YFK8_9SPHN|nr:MULTISPECIES: hypothetical protein [Sphingomonas]KZE18489.1 hypothetical protein AVT10_00015 [Sphingomonas hankookensis]WCP73391.1 hypothetical protein PPZ50_07565 [Sphingomonas hankookensis]
MPVISIIVEMQPLQPQRPMPDSSTGDVWDRGAAMCGLRALSRCWTAWNRSSLRIAGTLTSIHSSRGRASLVRLLRQP